MKKKIFITLLLVCMCGLAQTKDFTISWEASHDLTFGDTTITLPHFKGESYSYNFEDGLQFVSQWKITVPINERSIKLVDAKYADISISELYDLDKNTIPASTNISLKNASARGKTFAFLKLSPIIKTATGNYQKLLSFKISYKAGFETQRTNNNAKFGNSKRVSNSVLSTGEWYKFYIDTTGVFQLNRGFLQNLGVNVGAIDPRTIKIYGNGGKMLPYANAIPQPFDVQENAIQVVGENDGVFDNNDYILFYGEGPKAYDSESDTHINCYTDKTYYYLTVGGNTGKRIQTLNQPTGTVDMEITTFHDYKVHEKDIHNIGGVGRRWFGERFNINNRQQFTFNFPDIVTTTPVQLNIIAAAVSTTISSMAIVANGTPIQDLRFSPIGDSVIATQDTYANTINVSGQQLSIALNYNNNGNPSAIGYLDYISVEAERDLKFYGKQFRFKNKNVANNTGIGRYTIANASNLTAIWEVSDKFNVVAVQNTNPGNTFSFLSPLGQERLFMAVTPTDFFQPKTDANKRVANQNIKGTIFYNAQGVFQDIDYLIITPNDMLVQAERLAQINKEQYGLNVKVLTLDAIYAEFSTGNPDISAIRNAVKYVYDNASSPTERVKYLCMFGDGSYDYKDRVPNNTNIVPSWHSKPSFNLTNSFVSDDFFGMMDDSEGAMETSDMLDIAVGRILADTPQRAKILVDKIQDYHTKEAFGSWRNNFVLLSDDVDVDWERVLQKTTDSLGEQVSVEKPFVNVIKLHSDAFQQQTTSGGETYPEVNTGLLNAIDNGALVINYFGHGGEDGLASERLLGKRDIESFSNNYKYNCFVTVTCEFTRFDNPFRETAGEFTYWSPKAGAISLITTTRVVFVSFGVVFNYTLGKYLFSFSDTDNIPNGEYPSVAEALRLTKTDPSVAFSSQKRLVFCIGDPALKLTFPKPSIRLTAINDVPITQSTDTLKALSKIKFSGEVTDINGNILNAYNGVLSTTVYDKFQNRTTLANDGTRNRGELITMNFKTLGAVIFKGKASVTNGKFNFDFVVPKDISIPTGLGRVSFYATKSDFSEDQSGADLNHVVIGGVNENAEEDKVGPTISLYMNDENFVSGGITNQSPNLLAKLEDFNGINTASGIGHDIVAILDGDEANPYVLNDYYETEVDNYQKGIVNFPFRDLEPGLHTLTLKAWDVYNNSSIAEIQFVVFDENQELVITNVLNYPNPFVNYTEFWFNHNSSSPLDVSIQIFTVSGKLVRTLNGQTSGGIKATSSLSRDIVWDGRDDFGDKIGKGVYIYKLSVRSPLLNKKVEKIEKLVIL